MLNYNNFIQESNFEEEEDFKLVKIDLEKLKEIWNPFKNNIWIKLDKPITREEIKECLDKNILISPDAPKKMYLDFWDESTREEHISRIAWLIKNYDENYPIEIDFGIPGYCGTTITDGNHRLAAAIYLNKPYIIANVMGSIDRIKEFIYETI